MNKADHKHTSDELANINRILHFMWLMDPRGTDANRKDYNVRITISARVKIEVKAIKFKQECDTFAEVLWMLRCSIDQKWYFKEKDLRSLFQMAASDIEKGSPSPFGLPWPLADIVNLKDCLEKRSRGG